MAWDTDLDAALSAFEDAVGAYESARDAEVVAANILEAHRVVARNASDAHNAAVAAYEARNDELIALLADPVGKAADRAAKKAEVKAAWDAMNAEKANAQEQWGALNGTTGYLALANAAKHERESREEAMAAAGDAVRTVLEAGDDDQDVDETEHED